MNETEKRFEEFIENYLISEKADGQRHRMPVIVAMKAKICFWTSSL